MRGESVVRGGFVLWLLASLVSQSPFRRWDHLRRLDVFHLIIPDWRFFAPNPGIDDYHVLARDLGPDGARDPWFEVGFVGERRWTQFFWFPARRYEKTVFDAANELIKICVEAEDTEAASMTVPYLTLLNHVRASDRHAPAAQRTQFMVATSDGYAESEEPMLLYVSDTHRLDFA